MLRTLFASRASHDVDDTATTLPIDRLVALRAPAGREEHIARRAFTHLPGAARSRLRGRGLEFDDLRPYAEGDDLRHIDWKVTARTGRPHTRLYREERERAVTVAVDLRQSMFTGSHRLRAVVAGEVAARLIWGVAARRDRAGAIIFDDAEIVATRPSTRERGALEAVAAVSRLFAQGRAAMDRPHASPRTLDGIVNWINRTRRSAGAIILLTGLDHPGAELGTELAEAGRCGRLSLVLLSDRLETGGLEAGRYTWRAGGRSSETRLDAAGAARLRATLARLREIRRAAVAASGLPFIELDTDAPPADLFTMVERAGMM